MYLFILPAVSWDVFIFLSSPYITGHSSLGHSESSSRLKKKQFDNDTFGGSLLFEHMCYLYAKPSSNLTLFMGGIPTGKLWVAYDCLILIQKLENQHD